MRLLDRAKDLPLDPYMTLKEVCAKTGADYQAIWKRLLRDNDVTLYRVNDVLLVRKDVLERWNHS